MNKLRIQGVLRGHLGGYGKGIKLYLAGAEAGAQGEGQGEHLLPAGLEEAGAGHHNKRHISTASMLSPAPARALYF